MKKLLQILVLTVLTATSVVLFCSITYTYKNARTGMAMAKLTIPYSQPGTGGLNIAVLGDSSVYGNGVEDPRHSLAGLIGSGCPECRVSNYAVSGAKVHKLIDQVQAMDTDTQDIALVSIGYNDVLHFYVDLERSCTYLTNGVEALLPKSKTILVYNLPDAKHSRFYSAPLNNYFSQRSIHYNRCIQKLDSRVTVIDLWSKYDEALFRKHESGDLLHMNELGSNYWYSQINSFIESQR